MTITIGKRWVAFGAIIAVLVVAWSLSMASAQNVTVIHEHRERHCGLRGV